MCRGEREAATVEEKIWKKYTSRISRPKRFHTLSVESHSSIHLMTILILMINIISFNLKGVFRSFLLTLLTVL